jgi:hypothetical protein
MLFYFEGCTHQSLLSTYWQCMIQSFEFSQRKQPFQVSFISIRLEINPSTKTIKSCFHQFPTSSRPFTTKTDSTRKTILLRVIYPKKSTKSSKKSSFLSNKHLPTSPTPIPRSFLLLKTNIHILKKSLSFTTSFLTIMIPKNIFLKNPMPLKYNRVVSSNKNK